MAMIGDDDKLVKVYVLESVGSLNGEAAGNFGLTFSTGDVT